MLEVLVDCDACPVVDLIEDICKLYDIKVTLYADTNHALYSDYSDIKVIGASKDAVDFAIIKDIHPDCIVVTQDYGLASLVLSKHARAIHPKGKIYDESNIDQLLFERHVASVVRRNKKSHLKGPSKRTFEDDLRFKESFMKLISYSKEIESAF